MRHSLKPVPTISKGIQPNGRLEKKRYFHASDLHGISRLALTVVEGVLDLVETLHKKITRVPSSQRSARGISGFTYDRVRASTAFAGRWSEILLSGSAPASAVDVSSSEREAVIAALNGLFGDHLAASGNPLAIRMRFRRNGRPLDLDKTALAEAIPNATGKVVVLAHGLCRSDLQWRRRGHDHGACLAHDLGWTPVYLHYNTGLHVSTNGREFAGLLETLLLQWPVPVEEMAILAHSMGGLVARSAYFYGKAAGHTWPQKLRSMIFLGTPHQGAPLERGGNWLTAALGQRAFTAPLARLGRTRSAGITDLRYGNLLDEDWQGRDRFEHADDCRRRVPLPRGVKCYAIAATTGKEAGDIRDRLLGDGLIPVDTALGLHPERPRTLAFPKSRQWVAYGVHHLELLSRVEVYEKIREWMAQDVRKK